MSKGRVSGWLCFTLAVALAGVAGWHAYRIVEPALLWKAARAKAGTTRLRYKHDGKAMLVYYVYAQLSYEAAGQQIVSEGASDFHSYEFSGAKAIAEKIAASKDIPAYWNPSNPKEVRFALAYGELLGLKVAGSAVAAVLLALAGVWLRTNWLPAVACVRCSMPIKRHYRFCPNCRLSLRVAAS